MAFTCGFYNSVNHDRKYDAVQHGMVFDGIITDGIYATYLKAMVVKASSNPSEVIVQPGRAWFNHTWSYNDADYPVAAPDPEVVLDRIDTLVLDINSEDAVRDNQFLWIQGTPTSQVPEPPELIHTATHNQYPLCDVYRQAGTTQIYAADITNRVGTSDCPFVTGVLEGINIDDLLAQWDDEFHTWENATKASFEGWMLNQQAVYTAWWDALKTQMAGDVDDVEEWIQTIKDIIDEETATHLQLEIDEINSMLPAGSHITVTTTDTELYSRAVTITDEDNNTVTSQFDATGVAVFKSVPYVGNLTIEATDGIRTATAVVNTPYFARYEFPLAFWSATVNITSDTELGGETVTITDSSQILVGTVVLDASGAGVFNATYPDTYKFSVTHGGQTMEVSLAVTQETTYNVTIHAGFNWRGWVDTARDLDSSDYDSLEEVLADELAVRELCLEHACVDYLAAVPSVNADIETIINNDLFAKWVNNSDYSLDILGANVAIKALMDTADKYGYGEWTLVGQVPKMTSNTAPYGEVSASATLSGYDAYKAFNGTNSGESDCWYAQGTRTGYLRYKFATPCCVKQVTMRNRNYGTTADTAPLTFEIRGSNDNFVNDDNLLGSFTNTNTASNGASSYDVNNDNEYLYYEINVLDTVNAGNLSIGQLQFYAYAPKGNVPVMTSNSAPYGEAFGSNVISGREWYKAFDGASDSVANLNVSSGDSQIGYKSTNPINVKRVFVRFCSTASGTFNTSLFIEGSNDNSNWEILKEISTTYNTYSGGYTEEDIAINNNDDYYLYHRVRLSNSHEPAYSDIQFYGRELSVSVPVMTSLSTPYGHILVSSTYGSGEFASWNAFNSGTNGWMPAANDTVGNCNLSYEFPSKMLPVLFGGNGARTSSSTSNDTWKLMVSNDGTNWIDTNKSVTFNRYSLAPILEETLLEEDYKYCKFVLTSSGSITAAWGVKFYIYGKDYSEKEFEEGTTKKWLYDHGVELVNTDISGYTQDGVTSILDAEREASQIYLPPTSSGSIKHLYAVPSSEIDLSEYNLVRISAGNKGTAMNSNYGQVAILPAKAIGTQTASLSITDMKQSNGLDISSVSSGNLIVHGGESTRSYSFKEFWLE